MHNVFVVAMHRTRAAPSTALQWCIASTSRIASVICVACLVLTACTTSPTPAPTATAQPINRAATQPASTTSPAADIAGEVTPIALPELGTPTVVTSTPAAVNVISSVTAPRPQRNAAVLRSLLMTGASTVTYTVQPWDTLSGIAGAIGTTAADLRRVNGLGRTAIETGQMLTLRPTIRERAPALKLIPDSELVNSPTAAQFDMTAFMAQYPKSYLLKYTERFDGQVLRGPRIVERVAQELSVHPRLLLALLEYNAGWLTNPAPTGEKLKYPLGAHGSDRQTLSRQLSWAGARLNEGYYGWRLATRLWIQFTDNGRAYLSDQINAGSAGLQNYLAAISTRPGWATATVGIIGTYQKLFGDPWKNDLGQLVPDDLQQPEMYLPWEIGQTWLLTGGPHAAWGVGSPWAGLDFTTIDGRGCGTLRGWVTAVAEGTITRSVDGEVAQALDPSGDERKGWSVFYMHVGTRGRAKLGTQIGAGEPIGHPSCEGGYSEGSHLHIARKYNGEWIDAGGNIPFVMSGWTTTGGELEYDGWMMRASEVRTPCECRDESINGVSQ